MPFPEATKRWRLLRPLRFLFRMATSRRYRHTRFIEVLRPPDLFQPFTDTGENRYPHLFRYARENLPDRRGTNILSFGCSTGEEVFSLRRYFAEAAIKGIDINPRNIAVCQRKLRRSPDDWIEFEVAGSTAREKSGLYDAIFCMAVLRNGRLGSEGAERADPWIRFADFERVVEDFARCLKPGGLLFIAHSNFRFSDTAASAGFRVAFTRKTTLPGRRTPIYDRQDRLIDGATYDEVAFRKQ